MRPDATALAHASGWYAGQLTLRQRLGIFREVESGRSLFSLPQERDQVSHLLEVDGLFEAFGHERPARRAQLVDLGSKDGIFDTFGAAELQGGGGLFDEQPRDDLAAAVASETAT